MGDMVGKHMDNMSDEMDQASDHMSEAFKHVDRAIEAAGEEMLRKKTEHEEKIRRDEVRRTIVVDMVYKLGLPRLKCFVKTITLITENRFEEAASEMMDSKWARQTGVRAVRLSQMMSTGNYND